MGLDYEPVATTETATPSNSSTELSSKERDETHRNLTQAFYVVNCILIPFNFFALLTQVLMAALVTGLFTMSYVGIASTLLLFWLSIGVAMKGGFRWMKRIVAVELVLMLVAAWSFIYLIHISHNGPGLIVVPFILSHFPCLLFPAGAALFVVTSLLMRCCVWAGERLDRRFDRLQESA